MKFLVILVCLLFNHYWHKERSSPVVTWQKSFQHYLWERVQGWQPAAKYQEALRLLLLFLIPLALVYALLWLADGLLLGFVTLALHVIVVLLAMDRLNMAQLTARYLEYWRAGNHEGAWLLLQEQAAERVTGSFADYSALHRKFLDLLLGSYFEQLFVVVFWYLLLGPAGVLLYVLARQHVLGEGYADPLQWPEETDLTAWVARGVYALEWLPARLLALTFSLAGDFVATFACLRQRWLRVIAARELVLHCAEAALGSVNARMPVAAAGLAAPGEQPVTEEEAGYPERASRQVEELLNLLVRSQIIWIAVIAVMTLYGIGD